MSRKLAIVTSVISTLALLSLLVAAALVGAGSLFWGSVAARPGGGPAAADGEDSPEAVAARFVYAPYADKHKHVCDGDELRKEMERFYADYPPPRELRLKVERVEKLGPRAAVVRFDAFNGRNDTKVRCYVRQCGGHWLVDWSATVGRNAATVKQFQKNPPREQACLRFRAERSTSYAFRYKSAKDTHYSVRLIDPVHTANFLTGYVPKTSEPGKKIHALLSDGNSHELFLAVQWAGNGQVDIVDLVSSNWLEP